MTALDPLVYHLHRSGSGSWSHFSRAVEAFDASLDARSCARALAEHAIVEFDFNHERDWSVTAVQLVESAELGIVSWGGTARTLLHRDDIDIQTGRRSTWVDGVEYSYEQAVRIRKRGNSWPRCLAPISARSILDIIPSLDSVVGSRPLHTAPLRRALRLDVTIQERRNPGRFRSYELRRTWLPSDGVAACTNAVWKLDRANYVVSRNHCLFWAQHDVALWTGFRHAADRLGMEHLAYYDDDERSLQIAAFPRLPIAYVRALLLYGARESDSGRRDKRVFRNVDRRIAEWLGVKLGITLVR